MAKKATTRNADSPSVGASESPIPAKKVRGNPSKLQPFRNEREASERGKVGGVRSGEARRRKKLLRERMSEALMMAAQDPDLLESTQELGLPADHNLDLFVARALRSALKANDKDGAKWAELVAKWSGLFTEKIETENKHRIESAFDEVDVGELGETLSKLGKK